MVRVATDGSAIPNPGPGGWAWVCEDGTFDCAASAQTTNNIGELTAMKMAMLAHPTGDLLIEFDSQYAYMCITSWGPSWIKNGTTSSRKNMDLIAECIDILADHEGTVEWCKVKAHSAPGTFPLNERADRIANFMSSLRRTVPRSVARRLVTEEGL